MIGFKGSHYPKGVGPAVRLHFIRDVFLRPICRFVSWSRRDDAGWSWVGPYDPKEPIPNNGSIRIPAICCTRWI